MQKDSSRRRFPLADRIIEVIDDTLTGEVLLDEALKMIKASPKMSISSWVDLMSGKAFLPSTHRGYLMPSVSRKLIYKLYRRDLESHENRLPA